MATQVVKRLYFYVAAFIGLQMLAGGARDMLTLLLDVMFGRDVIAAGESNIERLTISVPLLIVGLPLWAIHWYAAQRGARRLEEQHAPMRRFYAYLVLLVAMLGLIFPARWLLAALLGIESSGFENSAIPASVAALLVNGAVWVYHWRVVAGDRASVEPEGWTATWRRWYLIIVQAVTLGMAAYGAADLLSQLIQAIISPAIGGSTAIQAPLTTLIAGFAFWMPHHLWARALVQERTSLRRDETRSTLRQVFAALVITTSAVAALSALVILIDAALSAALGGESVSAEVQQHITALAVLLIGAAIWVYHRQRLAYEALLSEETARGETARRIVGYLMAAIGAGALYFGLGGLVATLLRMAFAPDVVGARWHEPLSVYLALSIVGVVVYVGAAYSMERVVRASTSEEQTLARRIFLYAILFFGIVAVIVAVVALLRLLLAAGLGASEPGMAAEVGRWLGYALIAVAITAYHGMLLRRIGVARRSGREAMAGTTIVIVADEAQRRLFESAIAREAPEATLRFVDSREGSSLVEQLAGADALVVPLDVVVDGPLASTVRAFGGPRVLVPSETPGYTLAGQRLSPSSLARDAAQTLRRLLEERERTEPLTAPEEDAASA